MPSGYQFILDLLDRLAELDAMAIALAAIGFNYYLSKKSREDSAQVRQEEREHEVLREERRDVMAAVTSLVINHEKAVKLCLSLKYNWNAEKAQACWLHLEKGNQDITVIFLFASWQYIDSWIEINTSKARELLNYAFAHHEGKVKEAEYHEAFDSLYEAAKLENRNIYHKIREVFDSRDPL